MSPQITNFLLSKGFIVYGNGKVNLLADSIKNPHNINATLNRHLRELRTTLRETLNFKTKLTFFLVIINK